MKKLLLFIIISILHCSTRAQNTNISGQINKYSKVKSIEYCGNRITVDSPSLFQVGMQVLVIQMQGATIDQTNSGNYGNVTNYGYAGNYEIQTIDSIMLDTIKFRYEIERYYDPSHSVQLIPLPIYQTATVNGRLSCKQWDGNTGGVLLLKADTLVLNDTIDVSGKGFRGFFNNDSSQACFGNLTDYFYTDSMHGSIKGEGIVQYPYLFGRGKNANGGGGGDNENTGGGGGSNYGKGGVGGKIVYRTFTCQGNGPGDGGAALTYNNAVNKIFMGGGGGCGHGNNSEGTPGTNGAGICMIIANVVISNNKAILANGADQNLTAGSDGAGGAGAGGTVIMDVNQYIGNLAVKAQGGTGGSLDNDFLTRSCMGPGGGGSGGVLWVSQALLPANVTFTAQGGPNGINLGTGSTFCPYGVSNGALPGDSGGVVTGLASPISVRPYVRLHAAGSNDTALCNNQQLTLSAAGISSDSVSYIWSTGQQTATVNFLATQNNIYSVTVTDENTCSVIKRINVKVYNVSPNFTPNTSLCSPQNITLSAQNPGATAVTYAWSTGATTATTSVFADSSQAYTVTVYSDSLPTCRVTDTIQISVGNLNVTFSRDTAICPGNPVILRAMDTSAVGLSYVWSTGANTDSIIVSPTSDITYDVTVNAGAGCNATHSFVITMDFLGSFISADTTICPGGTANALVVVPNVNNVRYHWSNGDTTQQISVTSFSNQTYTVTVSNSNGCTGTASMNVNVDSVKVMTMPQSGDTAICPGSAATLSVSASGKGVVSYLWSTGQTQATINVTPPTNQVYSVIATDSLGCQAHDTITVTRDNNADHLVIQISAVPDTSAMPGDNVQLTVNGPHLMTFEWTPGATLNDSTIQSPIATPLKATEYCVSATDSINCTAQVCKEIIVGIPPAEIAIPDAFTPNNDGKNDLYFIKASDGTVVSSVKIYDRWGMLLFDDTNNLGWDGTFKGVAQSTGTYSCYITYYQKLYPEKPFYKMGSFNLLR